MNMMKSVGSFSEASPAQTDALHIRQNDLDPEARGAVSGIVQCRRRRGVSFPAAIHRRLDCRVLDASAPIRSLKTFSPRLASSLLIHWAEELLFCYSSPFLSSLGTYALPTRRGGQGSQLENVSDRRRAHGSSVCVYTTSVFASVSAFVSRMRSWSKYPVLCALAIYGDTPQVITILYEVSITMLVVYVG